MNPTTPRTAVIIGGASGIGRGIAATFAEHGDHVVVADIDHAKARTAAEEIGGDTRAYQVDVCSEESVVALFDAVTADLGAPECVVNTAGLNRLGAVTDQSVEDWQVVLNICLTGAFLVIKHAGRVVRDGGSIISISSLNGRQPAAGMAAYCAAKAGLEMLIQVAALELGHRGVRVTAIAPGLIDTPLVAPLFQLPGVREEFLDNTPLGRTGTVTDIAEAAVFLSTTGTWITGETLVVDGGAQTRRYPAVHDAVNAATRKAGS